MRKAWLVALVGWMTGCGNAQRPGPEAADTVTQSGPPTTAEGGVGGDGGASAEVSPRASAALTPAPSAPVEPSKPKLPRPVGRDCGHVLNPPVADFPRLEGCRVAFAGVRVTEERQCTLMACGEELPCCNACGPGDLAFLSEREPVLLSREGEPLSCRAGRNCTSQQDCAVPPGIADVTGVLWRDDRAWHLDVSELVHRVGTCARQTLQTSETPLTVRCEASYACERGREARVTCEGEAGSHVSHCTCEIGGRAVPLKKSVRGEPPQTCDGAVLACVAEAKRRAN
ncbi:MAG: hypothetical protein K0R38_851 [Polyangiaceae bacterium]|jgi:hypothetical protein|nr:hypothetical protein [Polyangiaceae bacterium]